MKSYTPETEFRIADNNSTLGISFIYNLKQNGYTGNEQNIVNDVTIQIHRNSLNRKQYEELEEVIITALNNKYFEPKVTCIESFYEVYFQRRNRFPNQRDGEFIFNLMHEVNPVMATKYTATDISPYNDDSKIDSFIAACFCKS